MLWNICRLLQHLNYHLDSINQKLGKPPPDHKLLGHEIQTILETHAELGDILKQLLKVFQFQLLTSRLYSTFCFIIVAYFDFYITDLMCDMIGESFKQLIVLLQMFNEKTALDEECERFAIFLTSKKEIFCGGMDRSAWFRVMSQLVSNALVLIQSHISIIRFFKKNHLEID
ncbi:uncharacterized protein LOC119603523 [Lucilia sericata]|uniref:uncharacterized protein LOC119603523 n=1 Tax=Lucilia sericata TaxID=13632 RepID=UPI0018A7FAAE|nr:uncharacterized protein LOC119603523 [Lucilia sericata]